MEKEKEHKNFPSLVIEWLEKLDKKIECLDKKVIDLREFLLGDEFHKNGFIAKSESHEKRIQKLEKINWKISGGLAVVVFVLTLINILVAVL